uniref:Adenosine kinase n=1 Tax=Arcella intermedia TaxID=1963864 RepID=A0A6B2L8P5_9EUKA
MKSAKVLLGIGNPLLDISVHVEKSYLDKYGKKVGDASLASESDLPMYKEIAENPDVLYIAGGSTQNTIRGAQWIVGQTGVTHYIGSVGADDNAQKLREAAKGDGVTTHYYVSEKSRTGCCAVLIVNQERSLVADLAAANDYQHSHYETEEIQNLIKSVDIFYSAGFFLTVSPNTVVEIGKYCAESNKILAWGVAAPFIVEFFWEKVQNVLPYVDYLIANETEAAALLAKLNIDGTDMSKAMKQVSELPKVNSKRTRTVIFTQGSQPVIAYHEGKFLSIEPPKLSKEEIVDTNGAGDAFLGGFLAGLMLDKPFEESVRAAMFTARYILQVSGTQYNKKCDFVWN